MDIRSHRCSLMHERNNLIISLYLIDKNAVRTLLSFELSGIYRGTTVQTGSDVRFHWRWIRICKIEFDEYFNSYNDLYDEYSTSGTTNF